MARNFLNYTNLSYDQILKQVNDKLVADPRFANFRESSIAQMMVEIFSSVAELLTHTIERRAEESFFDTAQLRGSVISLARQLGYSVQRPIPSTAKLKIKLKGDISAISGITAGANIQIPLHSSFSYGEFNFILKSTFTTQITQAMIDGMAYYRDDYETTFEVDYKDSDIILVEGTLKEKVIDGTTNILVGQPFQLYRIEDVEFSNIYGEDDFDSPITRVWVGSNKDREYSIDKRSLINWETVAALSNESQVNICVVRSSNKEDVELLFGDAKFANIGATSASGPQTTYENIFIQYLATKGSKGNQTGLIDEKLTYNGKIYTPTGTEITDKFEFTFKTNPIGGADMESIDSIRMNAPAIYYSLDRLVTAQDYVNYLKTLTSPIVIKNALAWGEQEEINRQHIDADKKMFNIALFSCLGNLYETGTSPYYPRELNNGLEDAVLDANFDVDSISRSYYNVYIKEDIISQLKDYACSAVYNSIHGNSSPAATASINYLSATFGSTSGTLYVNYGSSNSSYDPTLTGTSAIPLDMTPFNSGSYTSVSATMMGVADLITTTLQTLTDERGLQLTNSNFNDPALPMTVCIYNTVDSRFEVSGANSEPCYVTSFEGDLAEAIGLSGVNSNKLVTTLSEPISENITTVLKKVKDRSQITVNDVYMSPIIHDFKLSGTVYVDALYDIISVKNEINDNLYSWLNINADFNTPIYLSNVIEVIEAVKGVKYVDANFGVVYPSLGNGELYIAQQEIQDIITTWSALNLSYGEFTPGYRFTYDIGSSLYAIYAEAISEVTTFTLRYFYDKVKDLYDLLILDFADSVNINAFLDSSDFLTMITALYKDCVKTIRQNLINSHGDIGQEVLQSDNITSYYGYSIGSEIAKIKSELLFQYKV